MALDELNSDLANLGYLKRALEVADFSRVITGVAQPQITRQSLARMSVPLPPLPEQKRIAQILDAADALRAKRRESIAQLDALVQSTFLEMFGDPVANSRGWPQLTIKDAIDKKVILEIQDGNHGEKHPKIKDFISEGVPFIMANCISGQTLNVEKAYKLAPHWLSTLRVGFAKSGDVILSHKGTIGRIAVIPDNLNEVILSPQVTYYRPSEKISAQFLVGMFSTNEFRRLLEKNAKQSTRAYIGITRQMTLPIILPPLSEQEKFSAIVYVIASQKSHLQQHLTELNTLFASLQSRAFNGEL